MFVPVNPMQLTAIDGVWRSQALNHPAQGTGDDADGEDASQPEADEPTDPSQEKGAGASISDNSHRPAPFLGTPNS